MVKLFKDLTLLRVLTKLGAESFQQGLIFVLALLLSCTTLATAGFSSAPQRLDDSWPWAATYGLVDASGSSLLHTSGVVVAKTKTNKHTLIAYLTSFHSIRSFVSLSNNREPRLLGQFDFQTILSIKEEISGPIKIERIISKTEFDLAMVILTAPIEAYESIATLGFPANCQSSLGDFIGIVGFPSLLQNDFQVYLDPSQERRKIAKYLSYGKITESDLKTKNGDILKFTGTSADSRLGNSGGPAFNESGKLVGIVIGSRNLKDESYIGSDGGSAGFKTHSVITQCGVTKEFAQSAWLGYLSRQMISPGPVTTAY